MCGICGVVRPHGQPDVDRDQLRRMMDTIAHRGPDDAGVWVDGRVGLGHRRLSIVDLQSGHQPMANEDEQVWIAFNGEIYNHAALRPALEAAGHRYRTRSDTETIIHQYEVDGRASAGKLIGMFAYAIWDVARQQLILARDHVGVKPLYYALRSDGTIVFGSEIKALFASGLLTATLETHAIDEYFATGHVSGERTLFTGVRKLPPGHTLTWREGHVEVRPFWRVDTLPMAAAHPPLSLEDAARGFWDRFVPAVESQLMSDVPLGAFLSGGIDSSLLIAAMRALGVPSINSFSVGYAEADASELPMARVVARAFGTTHHEVIVSGTDFFDHLETLTWQRDLPLTFSASIPLHAVSQLAATTVKVVLTGEGSDELFAGYGRYPRALANLQWAKRLDQWLPAGARRVLGMAARGLGDGYVGDRAARSFLAAGGTVEASALEPFAEWRRPWRDRLLQRRVSRAAPFGAVGRAMEGGQLSLEALLRYDQRTYLEELLMKQDAMSMTSSIESRVPFLDLRLIEWAATLPDQVKLNGMVGKAVVRHAARSVLPAEVLAGPKRGFLVPLAQWLRTVGASHLDAAIPAADDPLLSAAPVQQLIASHRGGADHSGRLWRLLAFQVWRSSVLPRMAAMATSSAVIPTPVPHADV